jgi:hypothetical protein
MNTKNCVCILTVNACDIWMNFLDKFVNYDVYIVCDTNKVDYKRLYQTQYPRVKVIQIVNSEADKFGFCNSSSAISPLQKVNAWDKALYYFSVVNTSYEHVWFIEDDVYFYNEHTIVNIDNKYPDQDLLCNKIIPKSDDMKSTWFWHWPLFTINLPEPHFRAMVCASRLSKKLLACIHNYANQNKSIFFLETLFPTVALHYNLKYDTPDEFTHVEYRHDWLAEDINTTHFFHPMKNLNSHVDNRMIDRFV